MHKTAPTNYKAQVKNAFTDLNWYLSGYEANIRVRSETVQNFVRGNVPSKVIDLGCGDGSLSIPLLERGAAVTFFDLSEAMLQKVSSKLPPEKRALGTFINGDFASASFPERSFDLVIFVGVLAYVDNLISAARRIHQMIRPGGGLILEYTNASHAFGKLNFGYRDLTAQFRDPRCTTFRHKRRDVDAAFEAAGFALKKSYQYCYTLPIVLRYVSQGRRYKWMKALFGSAEEPRRQWLGSEIIRYYEA